MAVQTRRRSETRERLLAAALDLITETSLHTVSVETVCERAGFTRGAFYSNFDSMDALVVALFQRRAAQLGSDLETLAARVPVGRAASREDLRAAITAELASLPTDLAWYLLTLDMSAQAVRRPEAAAVLVVHRRRLRDQLRQVLQAGLDRLGRRSGIPVEHLAAAVMALYEGWQDQRFLDGVDEADATAQREEAITALLLALTEPDGER